MWAVLLKERTWPKWIFIAYFIINKIQRKLSAHAQAIMLLPDYTIILMRQRRYYVTTSWKFALGRQTGHDLAPLLGHEASRLRLHLAVTALQGLWEEDWLDAAPYLALVWSSSDILVLALTFGSGSDIYLILTLNSDWGNLFCCWQKNLFTPKEIPPHELLQEPLEVNQAQARIRLIAVQLNSTPLPPLTVRSIA